MSKKLLQEKFKDAIVQKALFKEYDYKIIKDNKTYHIKVLNVHSRTILSINSKYIWEIRLGKAVGLSFKTASTNRLNMSEFNKLSNKIIVFKSQPYKLLKYINESEVLDISGSSEIFDIKIFNQLKDVNL